MWSSWTTKDSDILLCLDHNGNEKWQRDFGAFETQHGNGNSPIILGDLVIYPHDHFGKSRVYAIDLKTGKDVWVRDRNSAKPSHSTPCIFRTANGKEQLIFTSDAHGIYALNPENGTELWESGPKTFDKRCVLSPVLVKARFSALAVVVVEATTSLQSLLQFPERVSPNWSTQSVRLHLTFPHPLPTRAFYIMSTIKELRPVWTLMMEKSSGWSDWTQTSLDPLWS